MKCEMACTKRAKIKVSMSGRGDSHCLCFRHSFMFVKQQIKTLGTYDFGIYIQRVPEGDKTHEINPEARHAVTTPEDRQRRNQTLVSVFKQNETAIYKDAGPDEFDDL